MEILSQIIIVTLAFVLVVPTLNQAAQLPPEFQKCKKDANVNSCLRESIEKSLRIMKDGVPSLQILPTDPLSITEISIEDSPNRPVNMKLHIKDSLFRGLTGCQVKRVNADVDKRHIEGEGFLPLLTIDGDYDMDGRFLVLPLKGNGKVHAKLDNVTVKVVFQAEPLMKNGNIHWDVKAFDVTVLNVAKFECDFTNLFNGDETLAKSTLRTLNENGLEFFETLRPAVEEAFSAVLRNLSNNIFHKVSEKDMYL